MKKKLSVFGNISSRKAVGPNSVPNFILKEFKDFKFILKEFKLKNP